MEEMLKVIFVSLMTSSISSGMFLHEPSLVPIHPFEYKNYSDFGFSMGFQSSTGNLIVGAPSVNLKGKVYNCDMKNASNLKEIICQENYINENELLGNPSKDENVRNQHIYLGSSIATTSDYFLTCAPLWSSYVRGSKSLYETIGRCFVFYGHNKTTRYRGTFDQYQFIQKSRRIGYRIKQYDSGTYSGGTGWSTLVDENNRLLLIVKTSLKGDIEYTALDQPTSNTRSMVYYKEMHFKVDNFQNLGFGFTSGKFFSNQTTYAFSMTTYRMDGIIEFIEYNPKTKNLSVLNKNIENKIYTIHNREVDIMFGSVLAAGDLNLDGLDELLVGAPAQTNEDCVECGALYIYVGGDMATIGERNHLLILPLSDNDKYFGRFGTALAVTDIDGDRIPEIVVSAPYEGGGVGAIYILSGYELYEKLNHPEYLISLSDLKYTQRIQKTIFRNLGFSLQFISDVDNNGCSDLVVGSPGNGTAMLLKSLQTINVSLSNTLIGEQIVREQDEHFTIEVCAIVEYPKPPNNIYAHLTLTVDITGDAAFIPESNINFNISCLDCPKKKSYCENSTVVLKDTEPRYYTYKTEALLHTDHIYNTHSTEFKNSWVVTSPHSKLNKSLEVARHCKGGDCRPRLFMELQWSGSDNQSYVLGSSALETVTVKVRNDGNSSYQACVRVDVEGAQLSVISCQEVDAEYRCDLLKPLKRYAEQSIELVLNMTMITNFDEKLIVKARLYENCNKDELFDKNITVNYVVPTDHVYVNGISNTRNLTNKEMEDTGTEIYDDQEYLITNNGSITWKKVVASISMKKRPYITKFKVLADKDHCIESHTNDLFILDCPLDLMPNSTRKIIVTTGILKSEMKKNLVHHKLETTSELELHLIPTKETKKSVVTTTITVERKKVANNKWLIALIAVIIALVILIIIFIILYKCGYFKRKQKQRLHVLRESFKQRNSRRNTHVSSATDEPGLADFQMESDDDNAFDPPIANHTTTDDGRALPCDNYLS